MTAGYYGFGAKARRPTKGKRGEPGRFVTLKSGRVIFIPEGKRVKWADVREKVRASQKRAGIRKEKLSAGASAAAEQGNSRLSSWLAEDANAPTWEDADTDARSALKAQVAKELSEATGIDEKTCSKFVKQWAKSSNDDDMRSLAIQRDAAEEFGLELSDFTKERIEKTRRTREQSIKKEMQQFGASREWAESSIDEASPHFHSLMDSADQRKLLRAMYDATQKSLAVRGIKEVRLHRGVGFDDDPEVWYARWREGSVEIETNVMESWSLGSSVAGDFAVRRATHHAVGVWFRTTVPAERILSCPITGFGCLTEGEVLVLGGASISGDMAEIGQVYEPREPWAEEEEELWAGEDY